MKLKRSTLVGMLTAGLVTLALTQLVATPSPVVAKNAFDDTLTIAVANPPDMPAAQTSTDWTQVQNTPQRTGYSSESLGTTFRVTWRRPFQPEKIYPQVQAIVYSGKVYVGTEMGNVYALNATTGTQAWKFTVGAPVLASVAAANNRIYFGAMDGAVYAVDVNTGAQVWKTSLLGRHGFSTAPVYADGKIMLGGRNGIFYALDPSTGNILWQYNAGSPILHTAAWNGGKVYFGAMNMYMYALNSSNGTLAWQSAKINAMAFKDYWPVVTGNRVFVRAMMMVKDTPGAKSFYAFNESDGRESITLPQFDAQTMNGATTPPCVDSSGYLVVPAPKPGSDYLTGWGRLNGSTGTMVDTLSDGSNAGFGNQDENLNVTCSSNLIFSMHTEEENANYTGAFDLNARRWTIIPGGWSNRQMSHNAQGGGGNPASISNGIVYHISYHELIARTTR